MKVFVTGATGFIGSHLCPVLISQGHHVVGLCRNEEAAEKLKKQGVEPFIAELKDFDKLEQAARNSDGVIHLAFVHDFSNYEAACKLDIEVANAFKKGLAGTGKPVIGTSGTLMLGASNGKIIDENATAVFGPRVECEKAFLGLAKDNIRAIVMRLPPFVYGNNGHGFLAAYIENAKRDKVVYYIDNGSKKSCATHVEDVVQAYALALTKGKAGAAYNVVGEYNYSFKEMAQAIGKLLNLEVKSVPKEQASPAHFWVPWAFSTDNQVAPILAERDLGWKAVHHGGILDDVVSGSYKVRAV